MEFAEVAGYYLLWHYTKALADLARIVSNYLWFIGNYFSINVLLRTLFSPWRRLAVTSGRGGEESFLGAFIINTIMRFVGFLVRAFTILFGALALAAVAVLGIGAFAAWLLLPVIIFFLFFAGLGYVITAI
ncbi:hypothetical protein KGQ31_01920 [Patescibacteria group bacterium]|nr:hypothetical protein [Patescibacteria group bacterium]